MRSKMTSITLTAVIFLVAAATPSSGSQRIIYVDDDANAPGDGSSWETAYKYLSDAFAAGWLAEGAVEIRVAQGLYKPDRSAADPNGTGIRDRISFYVLYGMTVKGGFAGVTADDPNERDIVRYPSILSGDLAGNDVELTDPLDMADEPTRADNSYHVVANGTGTRIGDREGPAGLSRELDGFVITGAHAPYQGGSGLGAHPGGGVYIRGNSLTKKITVRNCTIVGNYARAGGGGMACIDGTLDLVDCTLAQNGTLDSGGGAYIREGNVEFGNCRFQDNRAASDGGGASAEDSNVKFYGCSFDRNVAISGGAMSLSDESSIPYAAELVGCTFAYNRADSGYGGAIGIYLNTYLRDCRFLANEARWAGGAINNGWDMTAANCLFSGNRAGTEGGAIATAVGALHLLNCAFHGNRAPQGRFLSWVYCHTRGHVDVDNCIVSNGGNEVWHECRGPVTVNYTDLTGGLAAVHDLHNKVVWGPGNIDADPRFAAPGYWDVNGTPDNPDDDFFVDGDYHLRSQAGRWDAASQAWATDGVTSLCIDAGDSMAPIGHEPFPNGGRVNIGAYGGTTEASKSYFGEPVCETIIAGDINGDCRVDWEDLAIMALHWLNDRTPLPPPPSGVLVRR